MQRFAASLVALLIALGFGPTALAWPSEVKHSPSALESGEAEEGRYIWVNPGQDRVVVRVVGDRQYRLSFRLRWGAIYNLRTEGLDQNDEAKYSKHRDQLSVKLSGSDVPEGLDFMTEGNRVEIDCEDADGDDCSLEEIFLGDQGDHPDKLPFTINRKD